MILFQLYLWTFLAGAVAAVALSLLGAQLATRDRSMQTMCVGQGAMVGVLLVLGILPELGIGHSDLLPFLGALAISAVTFLVTDQLVSEKNASRNTVFAYVFGILLALGYLIGSLFPALESHMAQIYFGDLATLSEHESQATLVASLFFVSVLGLKWRAVSRQSFECAIFGDAIAESRAPRQMLAFKVLTLAMLCLTVQFLGFLFTVSLLFIPTGILSLAQGKGLGKHLILCSVLSMLASVVGFSLSLYQTRLPTAPTIVMVAALLGITYLFGETMVLKFRRARSPELAHA